MCYREAIQSVGLAFVGLHRLMVSPQCLHVTTHDSALRGRSWRHIRDLSKCQWDLAMERS